jgi:hypothetical protein
MFSPLFSAPPKPTIRQNAAMCMVFLELPVRGWKPPFFQEDERTWSLALDYPVDGCGALTANGIPFEDHDVLPILCRSLQDDPVLLLREMAPPFSLVWSSKETGETFVQNDGLGQAQLFEYRDDHVWAVTNRLFTLSALGLSLELERDEWAVRSTLGWFPLVMSGYKKTRYFQPGTQVRLGPDGVRRTIHDVLSEWVNPGKLSQADCLEMARCSLLKQVGAGVPQWEQPFADLSGGWDTRAVVSSLRASGAQFSVHVTGWEELHDVIIASKLAKIAGLDLKVVSGSAGMPADTPEECKRRIFLALLWQAGYIEGHQHKEFLSNYTHLDGGKLDIIGSHGEIGRGYYARMINAVSLDETRYEDQFITRLMKRMPSFTRRDLHDRIREIIKEAYRQADRFGLTGLARLDFFYLYERTRRWASGSLSSRPGIAFAPFLNPDYIRATFGYRGHGKETNPFHRHIIATNAPDWVTVPFASDLRGRKPSGDGAESGDQSGAETASPSGWKRSSGTADYDNLLYWRMVGKPIIDEALDRGGFWTTIYDPDRTKEHWQVAPDDLAIMHLVPHLLQDPLPL